MKIPFKLALPLSYLTASSVISFGQIDNKSALNHDWLKLSDPDFAAAYADMAFKGSLAERQRLAWMFFARVNQLIDDHNNGGMSGTGRVPAWMAWPTDPDTFGTIKPFEFQSKTPRRTMKPVRRGVFD